jgi:hypothetical protein
MKRSLILCLVATVSFAAGRVFNEIPTTAAAVGEQGSGGAAKCTGKNGDVNADGRVDLSDAVTILGNLFLGAPTELPPLCASARGLPDTGQTQCYDCSGQPTECLDCTGRPRPCGGFTDGFLALQDSFQHTGCPNNGNRFTDNGDGTVTDNCTGLMWQKDPGDVTQTDVDHATWCEALRFCNELQFAGHGDWRMPNVRELQSLVNYGIDGRSSIMLDPVFGSQPFDSLYWTSTSFQFNPERAWNVNFTSGNINPSVKGEEHLLVRAVRNAP